MRPAEMLAEVLREGAWARGRKWCVTRAWPADLDDPGAGYVLELRGEGGRVRGASLRDGVVQAPEDQALAALDLLVGQGWTVLAHRLGKRAVLRRGGSGAYRKLATSKATKRAMARADAVDRLLEGAPGVPPPPERVGADARSGMLDLAPASGVPLRDLLADSATELGPARAIGRRIGEVLSALATIELATVERTAEERGQAQLPVHGPADEVVVLDRWVAAACAMAPLSVDAASRLRDDADAVIAALRGEPEPAGVLAHRDLHDGQILVADDGDVTLLDWDTAAWTDPCLDAANLLAHLDLLVEQRPEAAERVAAASDGVLEALATGRHPAAGSPGQLDLWRRASAVRIAAVHAFRRVGGG